MTITGTIYSELNERSLDIECQAIAKWWIDNSLDNAYGGFIGEIDYYGVAVPNASKSVIQHSRILWFFSEAAHYFDSSQYRQIADRAYQYLRDNFNDEQFGGVVWELDYKGQCTNGKKQTYGQSFAIYGLSAYYKLTGKKEALVQALTYFKLTEKHAIEPQYGGYLEAFTQDWRTLNDVRLSDKDLNAPKSMNTHIHILEAYTTLYRVSQDELVKHALSNLITIICEKVLNNETHHLYLFQDIQWRDLSMSVSYGHDIECSWLLWDAMQALGDTSIKAKYRGIVVKIADVCLKQSMGDLGQVCDQMTIEDGKKHLTSYWWVQAEALVGFLNAFNLTGDNRYYKACESIWHFTQQQHIDKKNGEWHWLALRDQDDNSRIYKAGFWKAPYHNGRAMMEAATLLRKIDAQTIHQVAK